MIALGYVPEDAKKVVDFAPSMALVVGVLADGVVKIRLSRNFEHAKLEGGKRTGSLTPVTTCTSLGAKIPTNCHVLAAHVPKEKAAIGQLPLCPKAPTISFNDIDASHLSRVSGSQWQPHFLRDSNIARLR